MAIDERRLEFLEQSLQDRRSDFNELKEALRHLEVKMDERFANVEVRFLGIDNRFLAIENRLTALDSKFDTKFAALDSKFDAKFDAMESRFDARFEAFESKIDAQGSHFSSDLKELRVWSESGFDGVMKQFEVVHRKMDSQFRWLVGIQFGVLVTVIGVLLSR